MNASSSRDGGSFSRDGGPFSGSQNRGGGFGGGGRPSGSPPGGRGGQIGGFVESAEYLKLGYFDSQGNVRPEIITTEAEKVALDLIARSRSGQQLSYGQLRKFFSKAKFVALQLDSGQSFDSLRHKIAALERDAADAEGRGVAPPSLKVFIEKNSRLAQRDEKSFRRGFLPHFEGVMAYFRYHGPDK